ncbi:MAG: saccharopine dehydrogenase C-terminal domain-containing protein [Bacteroidia bacterium]
MKKILLVGLGKVGCLVGVMLSKRFKVTGLDQNNPHYPFDLPFTHTKGDVSDDSLFEKLLSEHDAVVSCLPYFLNKRIAEKAHKLKKHYFDLTEDVPTTSHILELSKTADSVMAPQCGLAPGYIGIVGSHLTKEFDRIRDIELRVGALPRYPNGLLAYSFNWSSYGVINEYLNDAEVIHNGVKKNVPSLEGFEYINIEGQEFEAFTTSGGLGTMCDTYDGQVDTLNYKTIRYPGHGKLMRFLMYELIMKNDLENLEKILSNAKPPVKDDVVYVYAVVEGWKNEKISRSEYYRAFYPIEFENQHWRAISWTTAGALAAAIELVADGILPQKGFIKQEEIPFEEFVKTQTGSLFLAKAKSLNEVQQEKPFS